MHISEGILPPQICLAGYAITGVCTWYSLRQIRKKTNPIENIPKASLLTAAFFVASLIHIPVPPTSIHLLLNGLMGIILGYYAFPAILIGLFFQAVMFQYGGLTTLGVHAAMMGIPALLAYYIFQLSQLKVWGKKKKSWVMLGLAFVAGAGSLAISATVYTVLGLIYLSDNLALTVKQNIIYLVLAGYAIQALIEGIFTVMIVSFLLRVKPDLLEV